MLGDLLRDELGFDGVIVTDALDMAGASAETGIPEAAVRALAAGADLLCLGSGTTRGDHRRRAHGHRRGGARGRLPEQRVAEAAARVRALASATAQRMPRARHPHRRHVRDAARTTTVARAFRVSDAARGLARLPGPARRRAGGQHRQPRRRRRRVGPGRPRCDGGRDRGAGRCAGRGRRAGRRAPATRHSPSVDRLRAAGHDVVLVECGWPRGGADIETYGGSPAVARALLALLRGEVGP